MYFKKLLVLILVIMLPCFLIGCENNMKSYLDEEYILVDDNGTIKCSNYDFVVCIEKKPGEKFKVLNLADVQLDDYEIEDELGIAVDTLQLIKELIEETNPDLITLSGDQSYGRPLAINTISSLINSYNIPWSFVFGNHDHECNELTIKEQVDLYTSYSNCIGSYGPKEAAVSNTAIPRAGNHIINIVERENDGFKIVRSIFMLNSGSNYTDPTKTGSRINGGNYDHLTKQQIEFYKWGIESSKKYSGGEYAKSTIIEHIPITAYANAITEAYNKEFSIYNLSGLVEDAKQYSIEDSYNGVWWNSDYKDSFGVCREVICCSPYEDGIFEILEQYGSTDSMLVGHDHANNFTIKYKGIVLSFSLKTGYGSYYLEDVNGGTVLSIDGNEIDIEHIYKFIG